MGRSASLPRPSRCSRCVCGSSSALEDVIELHLPEGGVLGIGVGPLDLRLCIVSHYLNRLQIWLRVKTANRSQRGLEDNLLWMSVVATAA